MFDPNAYVIWLQGLTPIILVLLVLTVLVLVSGILSGIKAKDFAWTYIADFLRTLILPKFGGWLLLESLAFFLSIAPPGAIPSGATEFSAAAVLVLAHGAYGLMFISLGAKLFTNLKELGGTTRASTIAVNDLDQVLLQSGLVQDITHLQLYLSVPSSMR